MNENRELQGDDLPMADDDGSNHDHNNMNDDMENDEDVDMLMQDEMDDDDNSFHESDDEEFQSDEEDSEEEEEPSLLFSKTLTWVNPVGGEKYSIDVSVLTNFRDRPMDALHVEAKMKLHLRHTQSITGVQGLDALIYSFLPQTANVGEFHGIMLRRPNHDLFGVLQEMGRDTFEVCRIFCKFNGRATRLEHPVLMQDEQSQDVNSGYIIHIHDVGIRPKYAGKDLGIRMLHEVLHFLRDPPPEFGQQEGWTLAVVESTPLGDNSSVAAHDEDRTYWYAVNDGIAGQMDQAENNNLRDRARHKICLQLARLGFLQAGRNSDMGQYWFMTKTMFQTTNSRDWISKDRAALTVDVYTKPRLPELSEIDSHLQMVAMQHHSQYEEWYQEHRRVKSNAEDVLRQFLNGPPDDEVNNDIQEIMSRLQRQEMELKRELKRSLKDAVRIPLSKGGSLDKGTVQHFCAPPCDTSDSFIVESLVEEGATADHRDIFGATPLHCAARSSNHHCIRSLLALGANLDVKDFSNQTPFDYWSYGNQLNDDLCRPFDMMHTIRNENEVVPYLESAKLLMPQVQREALIGDLIPPRMMEQLTQVADSEVESFTAYLNHVDMENVVFDDMMDSLHFDYIPHTMFRFPSLEEAPMSEYWKMIVFGYRLYWKAILDVLNSDEVPTVETVRFKAESLQAGATELYKGWNEIGIEYALDALFNIAKEVSEDAEDDEFAYESEEPENCLDQMYDAVWYMCVFKGGGNWPKRRSFEDEQKRGPHTVMWWEILGNARARQRQQQPGQEEEEQEEE